MSRWKLLVFRLVMWRQRRALRRLSKAYSRSAVAFTRAYEAGVFDGADAVEKLP